MNQLSILEIFLRLSLSLLFSGMIGFEREKNNSSAGFKTHILVGMGSTVVALIQMETIALVSSLNPDIKVSVDAVRLIAQVVSGIGFLGAGTIIITKRNIMGLTTAASIWGVASIGLALGMGYFEVAIISWVMILFVLLLFKKIFLVHGPQQFLVKYISSSKTTEKIVKVVENFDPKYQIVRISSSNFGDEVLKTYVFRIQPNHFIEFTNIATELSKIEDVMNVESTEIG